MPSFAPRYTPSCNTPAGILGLMVLILGLFPQSSYGQIPDSLSADVQVSLLTELPGEPIYAAFAHSALRFRDETAGVDMVFNYGTFDPTVPYFVPRFMYGRMDYYLSVYGMRLFMSSAATENRSVIEQVLNLTPYQAATLYARLREQSKPENRVYRYDFLKENCSTILLDLLRASTDGSLQFDSTGVPPITYRELLQPYVERRPFWDLGIDLALGAYVDQTAWYFDRDFLPVELKRIFDGASLDRSDASGTINSLVSRTDTLLWVGPGYSEEKAFPWLAILVWCLVAGWIAWNEFGRKADPGRSFRSDRWFFAVLGFLGLFLLFMWLGTLHYVTSSNWNIIWALPTHLVIVATWPWLKPILRQRYFQANAALMALLIVVQFFGPQHLHPVFLPIVVFIGWKSWRLSEALASPSGAKKIENVSSV